MNELNFYRFIMICLLLTAAVVGIKRYGDYRVNEFLTRQAPVPVQPVDQPQLAQLTPPTPAQLQKSWQPPANTAPGHRSPVPASPIVANPPLANPSTPFPSTMPYPTSAYATPPTIPKANPQVATYPAPKQRTTSPAINQPAIPQTANPGTNLNPPTPNRNHSGVNRYNPPLNQARSSKASLSSPPFTKGYSFSSPGNQPTPVSEESRLPILIAIQDIGIHDELTEEMFTEEQWPARLVPEGVATSVEEIDGMATTVRIGKKGTVLLSGLLEKSTLITREIPAGYKVIGLKLAPEDHLQGLLKAGDLVDIIAVFRGVNAGSTPRTFLRKIKVWSVGSRGRQNSSISRGTSVVGLLVTGKQAERIVLAQRIAELKLAMRGKQDADSSGNSEEPGRDDLIATGLSGSENAGTGARGTLSDQFPLHQNNSANPPVDPPATAAARQQNESAVAIEINKIRKQLGGASVADILGEKNTEQIFSRTIADLNQQRRPHSPTEQTAGKPATVADLDASELAIIQQHLREFANRLKDSRPDKAAAFQKMADRLELEPRTFSNQKR